MKGESVSCCPWFGPNFKHLCHSVTLCPTMVIIGRLATGAMSPAIAVTVHVQFTASNAQCHLCHQHLTLRNVCGCVALHGHLISAMALCHLLHLVVHLQTALDTAAVPRLCNCVAWCRWYFPCGAWLGKQHKASCTIPAQLKDPRLCDYEVRKVCVRAALVHM